MAYDSEITTTTGSIPVMKKFRNWHRVWAGLDWRRPPLIAEQGTSAERHPPAWIMCFVHHDGRTTLTRQDRGQSGRLRFINSLMSKGKMWRKNYFRSPSLIRVPPTI